MRNALSNGIEQQLVSLVGGAEALDSGNGTRYRSNWFSRFTVYHENVFNVNSAEVAFHPVSMAFSTGIPEGEIRNLLRGLRENTAVEINFNRQHQWPRVGVRTEDDAALIIAFIQSMLAIARARRDA